MAAARLVGDALEPVELAVGGAETRSADEGGEVGHRRVLYGGGEGGLADLLREPAGAAREVVDVRGGVFGDRPGVGKFRGVPVANQVPLVPLRRRPAGALRRAVGEVPGEDEGKLGLGSGGNPALQANGADRAGLLGVGAERAIG